MKKTYADLLGVIQITNAILGQDQTTLSSKKLVKIAKLLEPKLNEYNDKLEDLRLDNCSTDDKNNLILDEKGGYTYNKDGNRNLKNAIKDLLAQEIEVEPIVINNPKGLENFLFLDGFITGVEFNKPEIKEEEDVEL